MMKWRTNHLSEAPLAQQGRRPSWPARPGAAGSDTHSLNSNTMPVALIVTATIDESRIEEFLIAIEIGACAHGSF